MVELIFLFTIFHVVAFQSILLRAENHVLDGPHTSGLLVAVGEYIPIVAYTISYALGLFNGPKLQAKSLESG